MRILLEIPSADHMGQVRMALQDRIKALMELHYQSRGIRRSIHQSHNIYERCGGCLTLDEIANVAKKPQQLGFLGRIKNWFKDGQL